MEAIVLPILRFLQGPKQFNIPIFQRRYSWEKQHCQRLWDDLLRIGNNTGIKSHFIGSVVYIEPGTQNTGGVTKMLIIDGQQRLTTLSLLLSALSRAIKARGIDIGITSRKLVNYYIFNDEEEGELRYKQLLTEHDRETMIQLMDGNSNWFQVNNGLIELIDSKELPDSKSLSLVENYSFFEENLNDVNHEAIYKGIQKLRIVDIALDRNQDNPQLIFESLNSTGLSLSQADLIRNYVLMGQEPDNQKQLYMEYWLSMEKKFGKEYTKRFDRFIRDYLTVATRQIPNIRAVYEKFKEHLPVVENIENLNESLSELSRFARHYVNIVLLEEENLHLKECFRDIQDLRMEVSFPFLLEVYEDFKNGVIDDEEIIQILRLIESYVFRRAICGIPTNSLNKTFAALLTEVDKNNYLDSLKKIFIEKVSYRRFPKDHEFRQGFVIKDVYHFDRCNYLLRKLENHDNKQPIHRIEKFTIEHIMPQNDDLSEEWQEELGENWKEIQEKYLHTIGNLTLTGYNAELSDRSFREKKALKPGGFCDSRLRLNASLVNTDHWNEEAIQTRAKQLAEKALEIWIYPKLTDL